MEAGSWSARTVLGRGCASLSCVSSRSVLAAVRGVSSSIRGLGLLIYDPNSVG